MFNSVEIVYDNIYDYDDCDSDNIIISKEYFERAKQHGIERWSIYAQGGIPDEECMFCSMFYDCVYCPVHDYSAMIGAVTCCKEWQDWYDFSYKSGKKLKKAKAVLTKINSLSWDKWIETLQNSFAGSNIKFNE